MQRVWSSFKKTRYKKFTVIIIIIIIIIIMRTSQPLVVAKYVREGEGRGTTAVINFAHFLSRRRKRPRD